MKILMFLRDPVPAARVDVSILFDIELRQLGHKTDFVGVAKDDSTTSARSHGSVFACRSSASARLIDVARAFVHDVVIAWSLSGRYDIVIVRDRPIEAAVLFVIARLRGANTAYWMSFPIPLADRLNARAHWTRGARWRATLVWARGCVGSIVERRASLPLAGHVFVQSEVMKRESQARGVNPDKMSAIPMGIDATMLKGVIPAGEKLEQCIVYIGTLNQARRLDFLIDAFALIRRQVPTATLLVIGDGDHPSERLQLEDRVGSHGMRSAVRFTGRLPMRDAFAEAARCSIGVSLIPPSPLFDSLSPTKVVEYLGLGLPVVGNAIPDQRFIIESSGGGICVPFDIERFADACIALLNDPARRATCGKAGREFVLAHRNYRRLAQQVGHDLVSLRGLHFAPHTGTTTE